MLQRLRDHLEETGIIPPGSRVLVGYSGGSDSTCLLHLLHQLEIDVIAAHLHHGQRPEADKEMELCAAVCESLDIPFVSGKADVPGIARDMKIGLEEAGRNARYEFLRRAAFQTECALVATAHTIDDHVETILLNLTRGAGLSGLAGIHAHRDGIVRPLLIFSKAETREFCDERGLWYHDDPANTDLDFARARIRHRVLPELRTLNPRADEAIQRLSQTAQEEDLFLDSAAAAALERCEVPLNGHLRFLTFDVEAAFEAEAMRHLPPVLLRRALRLAVRTLGANLDHTQTHEAASGLRAAGRGSVTAEGGDVVLEWDENEVHARHLRPATPFRYNLTVPGETVSDEFGWTFTAYAAGRDQERRDPQNLEVAVAKESVSGPLHFRTFKPGDAIQPLGMSGTKKIADILSERRLTEAARRRLPIVCDVVGPIWIPGVCIAERVRVLSESEALIVMGFGPATKTP